MDSQSKRGRRRRFSKELWELLANGQMDDCRLTPQGSNYTFYANLSNGTHQQCRVVYKPRRGEAPLWDFPDGTLYRREYAAYLLSEALGWGFVPPTVIRDGVYGIGSVQLYVETDPMSNYFTLQESNPEELLRVCTYDVIANNADRKASHCLLGTDGRIWAIDHGITFHTEPKLRTVIWDFAGDPLPQKIIKDLERFLRRLDESEWFGKQFALLLRREELAALRYRVKDLIEYPVFPLPGLRRAVPWPWI
ncbi:MAG: SCO1664 family protein [Dehalococcoidia bacterium]